MGQPTGPGGPHLSSAKKRRLAALEQRSSGAPPAKRAPSATSSGAAPSGSSRPTQSQQQTSTQAPSERTPAPQTSAGDRVYAPLPEAVATGPVAHALNLTLDGSLAKMLEELMSTNPRASDSKNITGGKLRDKTLLLDNPAVKRDQKRRGGGGLPLTTHLASRKEQRREGLYDLKNTANLTFNLVLPVHRQWQAYIHNLLHPAQNLKEAQQLAFNADLHGCLLRVVEAPEHRYIDLRGIVVRDSRTAFFLVTPDDRVVMIPKKNCVFEFAIDAKRVVTLLGSGLLDNANGGSGGGKGTNSKGSSKKKKK